MKSKKRVKNENGYALLITLLALVLITVIGLSLMTMAMNTARITKSERDNQSSYYIAEAGLVEKRAQINEVARQVFAELKAEYDLIKEPANKKNFKLEEKFKVQVQERIKTSVVMTGNQSYSEQYAGSPESRVTVTSDVAQPLKYVITSVGKVPSDKGKPKEKIVSQTVEIKMIVPDSSETIEIPGENTVHKFNACFAILASEDINYGGGTVNGNVYSTKTVNVSGGTITENVYGNKVTLSGWGSVNNINSLTDVNVTGGTANGSVYGRGVSISGGTIKKNILSLLDANLNGGAVDGNVISYNNININGYPGLGGNVIAKNNININEDWYTGITGKYIYGNGIYFKNINNEHNKDARKKEKSLNIMGLISSYPVPEFLSFNNSYGNECIKNIPVLPSKEIAFPSIAPIQGESLSLGNGSKTIELTKDLYFNTINLSGGSTLNLDLKNTSRTIYVNKLDIPQGFIKLINPGKLKIVVLNQFSMGGSSQLNYVNDTTRNVDNVTIYYSGSNMLNFSNDLRLNAHLHIKNANLTISGGDKINGDIIAYGNSEIKINGGASAADKLILAPFSLIDIGGGGTVRANIIASTVSTSGGGTISPPTADYGEWEVPGSAPEIIEVPSYDEETTFLITDSLIQK